VNVFVLNLTTNQADLALELKAKNNANIKKKG